uniref:Uncharacterized protein n=1 Tax=Panagrolaimus sp. JU765 TaxID=591449 RepID=A0AC34QWN4_9BILA
MVAQGPDGRILGKANTVSSASPRQSCSSGTVPLERRYNKSCDWSPAGLTASHSQNDALSLKSFNNPIAQVSTDILRLHGYTSQFKNLLTTRSRRESGPGALLQRSSSHGRLILQLLP